jgi:beta-lactamase class A
MPDIQFPGRHLYGHRGFRAAALLLVSILAISACVSERQAASTPELEPTAQATVQQTVTPVPSPTPSSTPSPTPTATPEPTATPQPTATPTPEPTPEPTPDVSNAPYPVVCEREETGIDDELQQIVEDSLGDYADGFGIVITELTTGAQARINPDQSYYGASLYKAAVMYELIRQVEAGSLSFEQYVVIDDFYASQDLGTLGAFGWGAGSEITVLEALEAAIVISDNATAYLLGDLVGWHQLDETLHDLGATSTQFSWDELPTTAADIALILEAITCSDGVTDEHSQLMLDFLSSQTINNRLPLFLPDDAVVAHKTGNWSDANHDAGIVYGPDAVYVISVLSYYPGADDRIAQLSRDVYQHFHPETVVDQVDEEPAR